MKVGDRPIAKAITIKNILDDLIYDLASRHVKQQGRRKVTAEDLSAWLPLRVAWAELLVPHLDAYDQRV